MQDLRLVGVHENGEHLLLTGPDGEHYRLPLDESLRAAARRDRPRLGQLQIEMDGGMRPREVQALVRAGASAEEVAERSGWSVEKVRKYEGPIIAERVHVAEQGRQVRIRSRGGAASGAPPTLQGRVDQRMRERGVNPETNRWDAYRPQEAPHWTVVLTFAAGGRQRQASWSYDPTLRTVEASDDEARWLSADEPAPATPVPAAAPRASSVYDVEAEGGVAATVRRNAGAAASSDEPVDLMTAMRQRTTVGRRAGRRRSGSADPVRRDRDETSVLPIEGAGAGSARPAQVAADGQRAEPADPELPVPLEPAGAEVPPLEEPDGPPEPERGEQGGGAGERDAADEPGDHQGLGPERFGQAEPAIDTGTGDSDPDDGTDTDNDTADEAEPVAPQSMPAARDDVSPPTPKRSAKARTSVPSWDDIMFGAKRD